MAKKKTAEVVNKEETKVEPVAEVVEETTVEPVKTEEKSEIKLVKVKYNGTGRGTVIHDEMFPQFKPIHLMRVVLVGAGKFKTLKNGKRLPVYKEAPQVVEVSEKCYETNKNQLKLV